MDLMKMMGKAKELQAKMADLQEEIGQVEVEGFSGAGLVRVTVTGGGEARALVIDPSLMKEDEREILEDLIIAAFNDAQAKAKTLVQEKTQEQMAQMGLPAGMKLPF